MQTPQPPAEIELAQRCAAGDRAAQRTFFQQQRTRVHRTLYRILGSNRHVEDLIQDTFIATFGSLGSFRGGSTIGTWIDTIAARTAYRHLSRREPRADHLQAVVDLAAPSSDPERQAGAREAVHRLYALLDHMDAKYRIAYTLHVIDGRPIKEVARITSASIIAVKNRLWRARQMVQLRALRDPLISEC